MIQEFCLNKPHLGGFKADDVGFCIEGLGLGFRVRVLG